MPTALPGPNAPSASSMTTAPASPDGRTAPPRTDPGQRDLAALPKAHLHLHFTGSMRLDTLTELASTSRSRLPPSLLDGDPLHVPADHRGWFRFQRAYDTARHLVDSEEVMRRLVLEAALDDAAEGSRRLEMQVDPTSYAPFVGGITPALEIILDALPHASLDLSVHPAWSDRARHYAHAAATVLPEHASRARAIADGVAQLMATSDPGPVVPVHGDFYEANVLMDGEAVSCLLDVDSLGPGRRVDDLACLLGHVSVLDHLAPASYPRLRPALETWTRLAEKQVDPVALRARAAGVVLSLVAGARREDGGPWRSDAEGRLARAETWLAQARELQARRGPH